MLDLLTSSDAWISLATLTALEIVLGIDNVVFISILSARLPPERQEQARRLGLAGALVTRVLLLLTISWVMGLTAPLFAVLGREVAGRDLILIVGGLFLIAKATVEIYDKLEAEPQHAHRAAAPAAMTGVIVQIMLLDIVFSLDSVITAVGMARHIAVMVAAVVIAIGVMLAFAGTISRFIERHPSLKILALAFLNLIGFTLVLEGVGTHIEKGYIYFAMAFALAVELINLRVRARAPLHLHPRYAPPEPDAAPPAG